MLGDSERSELQSLSDKYNKIKTTYSGVKSQNYSKYLTPDIKALESGIASISNINGSSFMNVDQLMNSITGGFDSTFSSIKSFQMNVNNSRINGTAKGGSLMSQLIGLIMGIIELPKRFSYLFKSLMGGSLAIAKGQDGILKSIKLGAKDIWDLIFAILKIIYKYYLCVLSFTITTFFGCILIHFISLYFVILHLIASFVADTMNTYTGVDLSQSVDDLFENVKWPSFIQFVCYTCFGSPVKLRDVISDVGVIEDLGNRISYDFNNTMPRYLTPAKPLGTRALKDLDKAIN